MLFSFLHINCGSIGQQRKEPKVKGFKVAELILKRGDSMKGRVISGPSDTLYLVIGVTQYGLEVVNIQDYRNEIPDEGLFVPVKTRVTFASDNELSRYNRKLKTLRKKYNLPDPKAKGEDNGKVK